MDVRETFSTLQFTILEYGDELLDTHSTLPAFGFDLPADLLINARKNKFKKIKQDVLADPKNFSCSASRLPD